MKIIQGDLIKAAMDGKFNAIAHGCNCFCNMGAGIAKTIKNTFPDAYLEDCKTQKGDKEKLGKCSYSYKSKYCDVINCYTQYHYGGGRPNVDYNAIRKCMREINETYCGAEVGMPKIGCGLAKGDWDKVKKIIEEELTDVNVTIMYL